MPDTNEPFDPSDPSKSNKPDKSKKDKKDKKKRPKKPRIDIIGLEPARRLTRDLYEASTRLSDREARFLVDSYYLMQENRKRGYAQTRALTESGEPHGILTWFGNQAEVLEAQIEKGLDGYSQAHITGDWLRNIFGVGPVLAAGFQAYIYMGRWCEVCHGRSMEDCRYRQTRERNPVPPHDYIEVLACPTYGHIYQYAGIAGDGQHPWEKGERRPWNALLKTLCWKFSDVQVKFSNHPQCYYGSLYKQRKEQELAKNEAREFAHIAEARLARPKQSKEANYHRHGVLSPGHIDLRARRYTVKRFISDLHTVWFWLLYHQLPPMPYPHAYLEHAHYTPPLNAMPDLMKAIRQAGR